MTRDTALRANTRREYSMQEHGHSEVGQRQGQHVCKQSVDFWSPAYGEGKTTTIRILPGLNPDYNPQDPNSGGYWDPYRLQPYSTQSERSWGDWIRRYSAVRGMGEPGVTFLIADPTQTSAQDIQMTPAWVLFNAIDRAVANKQEQQGWAALLRGGKGRRAVLQRPSEMYLVQAFVAGHAAKTYWPPKGYAQEDKTLVMGLSTSAGESMITEMNRLKEGYQGDPYDYENAMANGDPVSLDYGRWVTFYTLADGDPRQRHQQQAAGWNAPSSRQQGGGAGQSDPIGYGAFLETHFQSVPARLRDQESVVYNKVKPWRDILIFPTLEEQAAMLADKLPPDVIGYAWRDHEEWIPEAVKRRLRGAHSVGGVPMAGVTGYGQQGLLPPTGPMPPQQGWGQLPPPPPMDMGGPPGMAPAQSGWAAPPPGMQQAAPPSQMAPPPPQVAAPGFPQQTAPGFAPQGAQAMPPIAAAFGPQQGAAGFPPQAGPPGFAPQAATPGFPPQAAPPGFQPQAAPGYPPQAQPPGFQPQAAPPGFGQPTAPPVQHQQPTAAPGWGQQPQQPQQPQQQMPAMAWGAQGNNAVDPAVPTGMPPGAPGMPQQQMPQQQFAPQQQMPQQQFAPQPQAGQFPGQPATGYAQPPGLGQPPNGLPPQGMGGQPTRAASALAAATAAAQQMQQPPQQ